MYCKRCGITLPRHSRREFCNDCIERFTKKETPNIRLIEDAKKAKAFGINYGELSSLREAIRIMARTLKC